jgi:hypothetical protein
MQMQPRIVRATKKIIRLNVRSPMSIRIAVIRTIPLLISCPHDLTTVEQIAACDTLSIAVQVGIVIGAMQLKTEISSRSSQSWVSWSSRYQEKPSAFYEDSVRFHSVNEPDPRE